MTRVPDQRKREQTTQMMAVPVTVTRFEARDGRAIFAQKPVMFIHHFAVFGMAQVAREEMQQFVFGAVEQLAERVIDFERFAVQADKRFGNCGIVKKRAPVARLQTHSHAVHRQFDIAQRGA